MDWLMTCPEINNLFSVLLNVNSGNIAVVPIASDTLLTEYTDGSGLKLYDFALVLLRSINDAANAEVNTNIQYDIEKIMLWVEEQDGKENYPALGEANNVYEVCCVENVPDIANIDEQCVKYMFSIQIKYLKQKGKN